MRHRRLALISVAVAAAGLFAVAPAQATNVDELLHNAQQTADSIYNPFVPDVPDATGGVELAGIPAGLPRPDGVDGPDGGGGSSYSQKYCGKYQWNDGTARGDSSKSPIPCIGGRGADYMVGTGTMDYPQVGAGRGYADIIVGRAGGDFLVGGQSNDVLWGDFTNGDTSSDGWDTLDGGPGFDKLTGGRGNDQLYGGPDADEFFAVDGYRDVIHCADSVEQAAGDWRLGNLDYVEYDRYDTLDASCRYAKKRYVP